MLSVYLNYPNPHISIHRDFSCSDVKKMQKVAQRHVRIDANSISAELLKFQNKDYKFGSDTTSNDMWLEIAFNDPAFERAVLDHIHRLVGYHYSPLAKVQIETHC